jgi:putative endonuclease
MRLPAIKGMTDRGLAAALPKRPSGKPTHYIRGRAPVRIGSCSLRGMGSHATVALGISGEKLACDELARRGYAVLATRYRTRVGEIDIIAQDGPTLVFVEVKTRSSDDFGIPAEAVTWRKQRRIVTMARWYLSEKRLHGCLCRFDVVTVLCRPGLVPEVDLVKNAFMAS